MNMYHLKPTTDFTYTALEHLLRSLLSQGYAFQTFEQFIRQPEKKAIILRHDVDKRARNSYRTAVIENTLGIKGSYYFRITGQSNKPWVISEITSLGHEIGYHYEDLSLSCGDPEIAIAAFERNLQYFRSYYPVSTICMHGSPSSKWDNRDVWKKYNYRDFNIIAEPYFNLAANEVLYLTDTGRKWNGEKFSVRDKMEQPGFKELKGKLKSTRDIIDALHRQELPQKIMITIHPQRWTNNPASWLLEYIAQHLKNLLKRILFVRK